MSGFPLLQEVGSVSVSSCLHCTVSRPTVLSKQFDCVSLLKASIKSILVLEWLCRPNHMNKWNIWRKWAFCHGSGYVLVFTLLAARHVARRRWRKSQACAGERAGQVDKKRAGIERINRNRKVDSRIGRGGWESRVTGIFVTGGLNLHS